MSRRWGAEVLVVAALGGNALLRRGELMTPQAQERNVARAAAHLARIVRDGHECLNLRFPGATEFQWPLMTKSGVKRFRAAGRYECDDGDILVDWALGGHGIALKPVFEVAHHLKSGALVMVAEDTPPEPIQMACLFAHRRLQDPKARLFMDFVSDRITDEIKSSGFPD